MTSFRVWVAGCSTNEEAYSIAIAIDQALHDSAKPISVRIFATDVDAAIEQASKGEYSHQSIERIPDELRKKYFVATDTGFQVTQRIREQIVFAQHNFYLIHRFSISI